MPLPPESAAPLPPSRSNLEDLLLSATLAPSPDNNQPWQFEAASDGSVTLFHDLSRALPSDVDFMFSMIALGAALENLCIAGQERGWHPHVEDLPQAQSAGKPGEPIAMVRFSAGGTSDPLYPFLAQRATCRKPYARQPVAEAARNTLAAAVKRFPETALHWVSEREGIARLAWLVAATDRIRVEYQPFHEELYRQLRFTAAEAEATRDGLDVRTLELPSFALGLLRRLRPWRRMRMLNRFGLSKLLGVASAQLVKDSGTVGLMTTGVTTRQGYLQAGRAFQRVWLSATQLGLRLHPLGSIPIFLSLLQRKQGAGLAPGHRAVLERVAPPFFEIFPAAAGRGLVLLFRLGEAEPPAVRSLRRPVSAVLR
jgi:nitroreductase